MAEILALLSEYAREDRCDEYDEGLKGPAFDSHRLLVSDMAITR